MKWEKFREHMRDLSVFEYSGASRRWTREELETISRLPESGELRAALEAAFEAGSRWRQRGVLGSVARALGYKDLSYVKPGDDFSVEQRRVVVARVEGLRKSLDAATSQLNALRAKINTPHTDEFFEAVRLEAAHQLERWPEEHDAAKTPADWFWLLGRLAGKAVENPEKRRHHIVSSAAVLLNWFRWWVEKDRPRTRRERNLQLPADCDGTGECLWCQDYKDAAPFPSRPGCPYGDPPKPGPWGPDEHGGYESDAGDGVLLQVIAGALNGPVQWQVGDTMGDLCVTGDASSVELAQRRAEKCATLLVMDQGRWRLARRMTVAEAVAFVEGDVR